MHKEVYAMGNKSPQKQSKQPKQSSLPPLPSYSDLYGHPPHSQPYAVGHHVEVWAHHPVYNRPSYTKQILITTAATAIGGILGAGIGFAALGLPGAVAGFFFGAALLGTVAFVGSRHLSRPTPIGMQTNPIASVSHHVMFNGPGNTFNGPSNTGRKGAFSFFKTTHPSTPKPKSPDFHGKFGPVPA
jgi:hypothetical protein